MVKYVKEVEYCSYCKNRENDIICSKCISHFKASNNMEVLYFEQPIPITNDLFTIK